LSSIRGSKAPKAFKCNRNDVLSAVFIVPINNEASNTHPHPTTFLSALRPCAEYWLRVPKTLKPPLLPFAYSSQKLLKYHPEYGPQKSAIKISKRHI
jgi:hypothetical protein